MKSIGFIYSSDQRFEELITANELSSQSEYLIRIHTCIHNIKTIRPFINKILSYLPNSKIVGSSTSGVIFGGKIVTDCCLISITEFENAKIETCSSALYNQNGYSLDGRVVADKLIYSVVTDKTKFILAFSPKPFLNIDSFVERINVTSPYVKLAGGVANTPAVPLFSMTIAESFVFNEKGVYQNSIVCAAIDSSSLSIYSDVVNAAVPVGETHKITSADENIIRTIDGKNAVEWYEETLGIKFSELENPEEIPVIFPLVRTERDNLPSAVFYSPQDETNTAFFGEPDPIMYMLHGPEENENVRISYISTQNSVNVCENVYKNISSHTAEVLFGYSCVSRQNIFNNCAKWELAPFKKTNLCGAMVAGEFANVNNVNRYSAFSFTITALAEHESYQKINVGLLSERSHELVSSNESIIEFLLRHSTVSGSDSSQPEIKDKFFKDPDTGLYNINKYLYDLSIGKIDKICMITIKNESLIKAFMSGSDFLDYLNRFNRSIIEYIGEKYYNYYIYKETTLIVAANPKISNDDFVDKIQSVQNFMLEFKFSSYAPVCEFSVVMNEDDMIKKAELTLNAMRLKHTCFLVYTSDMGLEQLNAQKMKMIMILNNAISNNLVIPYFQGIRDNTAGNINMYESLMRIQDPGGNIYAPNHFMDIAKEYGYYSDISHIMINKVMNIFRNRNENVTINMNISDVYNYKTVHSILEFLRTAPHPENFVFELTETEEIVDYQVVFEFVEKVRSLGGKIAIDDFGSGFSNIVHVFKIPSDYIKIDGEIIKNITTDIYAVEFLQMIADWSKKHSKEIIAEFVEDNDIQRVVENYGIRFSQGYLYSKPSKLF